MPAKIVWMSRHSPTPSQVRELERLFPGHDFQVETRPFSGASQIVKRFHDTGATEMVVVAPWTVLNELVKLGLKPLVAKMENVPCDSKEAEIVLGHGRRRRCQRFVRFERCIGIDMITKPINPKGQQ